MNKRFWQTDAFKQLSQEWDEKLKAEGLNELKQCAGYTLRRTSQIEKENKEYYYEKLSHFMDYNPPRARIDRAVMSYAILGYSKCAIARALDGLCHRETIRFIIRKYENAWNIRRWTEKELDTNWKIRQQTVLTR